MICFDNAPVSSKNILQLFNFWKSFLEFLLRNLRKFLLKPKTLKKVKVKVLGTGDIKVKVNIMADKFSKSAQAKIEKAGGKIETVK